MGKRAAGAIAESLIRAGLSPDTPALVVENASLPGERIVRTRLDLLAIATSASVTDGPAILIVGNAVTRKTKLSTAREIVTLGDR
jgi:uroporphyrin-III C-methyltransferase